MIKRYAFITTVIAGIAVAVHFASAAISFGGFTFDQTVTTSQGKEYYVDIIPGNATGMTNGKYDLETKLGFYGVTDPDNDGYFTSDIDDKTYIKFKKKGTNNYLGQSETAASGSATNPNPTGYLVYYLMRSSGNGLYVDPGEYTVDAVLNGVVVSTYDVCLPTFTSSTGNAIGNVTCGAQPGGASSTATSSTSTASTTVPGGPYTGKFTYDTTAVPTANCSTSSGDCTFTKKIKGTQLGDVALYINMYPMSDFDVGGHKGFSVSGGYFYTVKVYPGKQYVATVTVPMSVLAPKMDAMQVADRKYYIEFTDVSDTNHVSNKKLYDFGTVIPMPPAVQTNATFDLVSLLSPSTTVTIKGTLTASGSVTVTSKVDLYMWPVGGTPVKVQSSDELTLNSGGTSITMEQSGLAPNTSYNYKFVVAATGENVYENTFSTNISADQAQAFMDGKCGVAIESPQAVEPSAEADLCSAGTPTSVQGTGPWTWSCTGTGGGADDPCTAESLSSGGGASCGNAADETLTEMPTADADLCDKGTPSVVNQIATGWSWTCTFDNNEKPCSAKKSEVDPGGDGDPNAGNKNFLQNPFKTLDSFPKIIKAVVNNIVLPIAVPFIALMLIYSGFLFVVARKDGNVYTIQKAKQTLVMTLIGAVLVLGCFVIANALQGTINSITSMRYQINSSAQV
jgi:hypothetical protein